VLQYAVVVELYEEFVTLLARHESSIAAEVLVIDHSSGEVGVDHSQGRLNHCLGVLVRGLRIGRESSFTLPGQVPSQAHATTATKSPIPPVHLRELVLVL
jgi:hypothetical protein